MNALKTALKRGRRFFAPMSWLSPVETPYRERSWDKSIVAERPAESRLFGKVRCSEEREAMLRFLDMIQPELAGRIIDIGSGKSYLKRMALAPGATVTAQDAVAYDGVDLVCDAAALSERVAPGTVDAVTCFEVLEHLPDPFGAVREVFKVLKPGGRFYGTVPFRYPIHGWKPGAGRLDYWRFTEHGLRLLLEPHCDDVRLYYSGRLREEPVAYSFIARKKA